MSNKKMTKTQLERKKKKLEAKAAQKARYQAYKDAGMNTKSKRALMSARGQRGVKLVDHRLGPCGNVGCRKCQPQDGARR